MGPSHPTISSNIHAVQLVNSFVVLRIDYCDSLFVGLPAGQLDRIQSAAQCGNLRTEKVRPHYAVPEGHCLSGSSESEKQMLFIDVQDVQWTGSFVHIQLLHKHR